MLTTTILRSWRWINLSVPGSQRSLPLDARTISTRMYIATEMPPDMRKMTPQQFTNRVAPVTLASKNFNKIFCVGYNKTGTTTLESTLRLYGFHMPRQPEQEVRLTRRVFSTDYSEFLSFVSKYDAFQDMPFSQGLTFVAADALFPNSKFILSVRDSEAWYRSLVAFHKKLFNIDASASSEQDFRQKHTYLYKDYGYSNKQRHLTRYEAGNPVVDWSRLYDKDYYIAEYESRNDAIRKYFISAPEKLLVIDVTREKTTRKICTFLNIPEEFAIPMPHRNKT